MITIFMQKFWSVNSTLGQEKHVYACKERCVTKFLMSKCSRGNFVHWNKSSSKTIKGFWSYLEKNLQWREERREGGEHTPIKIREVLTRLWMHVMQLEFSSTLNPCFLVHALIDALCPLSCN